jgi:hypothetical protein
LIAFYLSPAPISIPSPAIQRLLAKREQDHNSTLDFVSTTCKRVNIQIDHELEREAEKLQEGLTTIKKKIENGSRVVLKSEDDEVVSHFSVFGVYIGFFSSEL